MNIIEENCDYNWRRMYVAQLGAVRHGARLRRRFSNKHPIPEKDRAAAVLALRAFWRDRNRNKLRIQKALKP